MIQHPWQRLLNAGLAHPVRHALLLALVTALTLLAAVTSLRVEGDVARAIKGVSPAFASYERLESLFGAPSKDEALLVTADDFGDPDSFAALEDLVLNLQLTDGVRGVLSIFVLPDPSGEALSYLSRPDQAALGPAERLTGLRAASPLAVNLMSQDRTATLLLILPDLTVSPEIRLQALQSEFSYADPALTVQSVSLAELQREISAALVKDQLFVTPIATLLCIGLALVLFRSWRAALLCALPALIGLGWTFGTLALLGIPFDPLMSIVPTIVLVLGIADCVHAFHAVQRHAGEGDMRMAIRRGLLETMPAVILAALTTALAFLCLIFVGSPTLSNVAIAGPIGLGLATLAVFLVLPPAAVLLFGTGPLRPFRALEFRALTTAALATMRRFRLVSLASLVLLALLLVAQSQTVIGYRLMDHVPRGGEFRATLDRMQQGLPGSDQSFVILPAPDPQPGFQEADRALLQRAGQALYGSDAFILPDREGPGSDNAILRRFESADGAYFAVPVIGQLNWTWAETLEAAGQTRAKLLAAGLQDAELAGYSIMSSVELPVVIRELRLSFYIAVALVTVLAAILLGSVRVALLALVPNLLPILGVEAWLVLSDRPLTIIGGIAFTIAFGIAVDDTIHLLNRIRLARGPDKRIDRNAIEEALRSTAAPIVTTSLVLLAGFSVTMVSALPSVSLFGQLTAAAMMLALITDLFLFPSLLRWGGLGERTR
ncbi:efflux RND transporter permease subunit [Antarctobacter jejuensis]|uniref:efflux RND transporter permease subunit n=1 Tax=Antarctobacter jejuensis TaxID=1439938 RepID=UPI003FD67FFC